MSRPFDQPNDLGQQFERWYPAVFRYFRLRGADADTANDLASAVFERALQRLNRYDASKGAFSTWLFTIARHTGANYWKAQLTRGGSWVEPLEDLPDRLPQPEEALVGQEELAETLAALALLEERDRELLALKFSARMTNRQISALTGLSESNVGVILYRAIQRMRSMIVTNIGEVTRERREENPGI